MYRVLLADNEQIFVNGMEEIFQALQNFQIAAIVQDVDKLTETCQRIKPDLVITRTFYFYKNTAFQAVEKLKRFCPETKVLVMLDTDKFAHLEMAIDAGADACIQRSASTLEYVSALQRVMASEPVAAAVKGGNAWGPDKVSLTGEEMKIVLMLCQNLSQEQIRSSLQMDEEKLEACIAKMLAKTRHRNVLGLIFEAIHKGYGYSWRAEVG